MACRTESKTIDDAEYSVTQWPASKAMVMKLRITKMLGGALRHLLESREGESEEDKAATVMNAISALFEGATPDEAFTLIKDCVVGVGCDGKRITDSSFDLVFDADSIMTIYKVFIYVLQVNYGNLLQGQFLGEKLASVNL